MIVRVGFVDELEKVLSSIGFSQYLDTFVQNDIDMSLIDDLTLDELKEIGNFLRRISQPIQHGHVVFA